MVTDWLEIDGELFPPLQYELFQYQFEQDLFYLHRELAKAYATRVDKTFMEVFDNAK